MARVSVPDDLPEFLRDHIRRYLETDGADGHLWDSTVVGGPGPVPTLLLTTRGRKTGNPRILPMIYDRTPTGWRPHPSRLVSEPGGRAGGGCTGGGQEIPRPGAYRRGCRAGCHLAADGGDLSALRPLPGPYRAGYSGGRSRAAGSLNSPARRAGI